MSWQMNGSRNPIPTRLLDKSKNPTAHLLHPKSTRFHPVYMKGYAIAAGHEATVAAAQEVLEAGGNAMDAAAAAYLMAIVAEPAMASIWAGAIALVQDQNGNTQMLDGFCQTPKTKSEDAEHWPIDVVFDGVTERYYGGPGSVAVSGAMKLVDVLCRSYGRMSLKEAAQPAIKAATEGLAINSFQRTDLKLLSPIFLHNEYLKKLYFDEKDEVYAVGTVVQMKDVADSLEAISHEGVDLLYRGEMGEMIIGALAGQGHLSRADLEAYELGLAPSFLKSLGDTTVHLPDLPSKGTYVLAALLGDPHRDLKTLAERCQVLRSAEKDLQRIMSLAGLRDRKVINQKTAGGTSHLSIIDGQGNAVSMSFSIGEGSALVVPGTGIHLNNMLGEPSLLPAGIGSWRPDQRLHSMMCPVMIETPSSLTLLGSGGANRIPHVLAQVMRRLMTEGKTLEEAITAPRFNVAAGVFHREEGLELDKVAGLISKNWQTGDMYFGGVHSVTRDQAGYRAFGDPRREGRSAEVNL